MSGVVVIRALLVASAPLTALVPASRIVVGDLPLNTVMPAISITQISSVPRNTVSMNEAKVLHTDRVQVSVLVKGPQGAPSGLGYPGQKALLKLVLAACPNTSGIVNGVQVDSVLPDIAGPDLYDDVSSLFAGSRDFIVKYLAP